LYFFNEKFMKLSIIIPVYNEKETILKLLSSLREIKFPCLTEIIIIDDGSTDGTDQILKSLSFPDLKVIFQKENYGKGAALRRGFKEAQGDLIAIQDADLEYNPQDLSKLVQIILKGKSEIVYGSRFLRLSKSQIRYPIFYLGNKLISFLFFLFYGVKITDPWTGYKVFKKSFLKDLNLKSSGFDLELELTAKFLRRGYKILEFPISYQSRSYQEGKKIKWTDGLKAIYKIIKYRFLL